MVRIGWVGTGWSDQGLRNNPGTGGRGGGTGALEESAVSCVLGIREVSG